MTRFLEEDRRARCSIACCLEVLAHDAWALSISFVWTLDEIINLNRAMLFLMELRYVHLSNSYRGRAGAGWIVGSRPVVLLLEKKYIVNLKVGPEWFERLTEILVILSALLSFQKVSWNQSHHQSAGGKDFINLIWLKVMLRANNIRTKIHISLL